MGATEERKQKRWSEKRGKTWRRCAGSIEHITVVTKRESHAPAWSIEFRQWNEQHGTQVVRKRKEKIIVHGDSIVRNSWE